MNLKTTKNLEDYFPPVDVPLTACQDWAIVQMKKSVGEERTRGGIILTNVKSDDERNQEEWHETIAKVLAIGPVFQRNRDTLEPWPECKTGNEINVGDIVRMPEFISGRFTVKAKNGDEIKCIFVRDVQIMGRATDPIEVIQRVKSYVPLTERKV